MNRSVVSGLALGLLLAGSASAQTTSEPPSPAMDASAPAAPEAATPPRAGPIVNYVVRRKMPAFSYLTPGKAAFAMVGALASLSEGKAIVEQNHIEDPAVGLGHELASLFAATKGGVVAPAPITIEGEKGEDLAPKAAGARYVVDLQTASWTSIYFPMDWTHFGLMYGAVFKIVDMQDVKVVAKGRCFVKAKQTPDSPTSAELLDNEAAGLKKLNRAAAVDCLAEIKSKTPELAGPAPTLAP